MVELLVGSEGLLSCLEAVEACDGVEDYGFSVGEVWEPLRDEGLLPQALRPPDV